MTEAPTTVNCPKCGTEVNVNEIVRQNAERILRSEYEAKLQAERTKVLEQQALLASKEATLNTKESEFEQRLQTTLKTQINAERKVFEKSVKEKLELEQSEANKALVEELEKKSQQLKELNNTKAQLKMMQLEKEELASANEIVKQNAEQIMRNEYEAKLQAERTKVTEQQALLASNEAALKTQFKEERKEIETAIKVKLELEQSEANKVLLEELEKKSQQLTEFNKTKAMLVKTQLEKEELSSSLEAKIQERFNETLKEKTKEIVNQESAKSDKRMSEQAEMINQLKKQLVESQRKIEQGSMQIQGETQEVAIEQFLKENFPFDEIEEIKKGVKGGDCLQKIHTRELANCGTIYYESKRVKVFQMAWVDKLKQDMIEIGANIGVIVTEVLPADMLRAGQVSGIWVCTFEEFKGLSSVLRESLILVNKAISTQVNKGDKMEMLYTFLTSSEFVMQIEAIVGGFSQMQTDLESEKRSISRIWKTREKQIALVSSNAINMYGSLKGIIGNAIPTVRALELPVGEAIE